MTVNSKCRIKKEFIIGYLLLICFCFMLLIIRTGNTFNPDIVFINASITSNLSNFYLSMLGYLTCGFIMILFKVNFRWVIALGISLIVANFACELYLTVSNVPDIMDAVYGLVGTLFSFAYLAFLKKYGVIVK